MKKTLSAALAALLILTGLLAACSRSGDQDPADTGEAVTIPAITIPTEPDDRTFTDTAPFAETLDNLFANNPPADAEDFTYEVGEDGVTVTAYVGGGDLVVVIPDTLEGKPVVAIASGAFADITSLKAVSVPDTVVSIGKGAFEGCKSLTSLRTPVFTCEDAPYFGALFGAKSHDAQGSAVPAGLATLVLTGGEVIPDYAFYACRGLTAVMLPESLAEIGSFAFYGCGALSYVTAGNTALRSVGRNAFTNCAALLSLELPGTVESLGFAMLEGCGTLEALTLPFAGGSPAGTSDDDGKPAPNAYLGYLFGATDYTFTAGYLPASLIAVTLLEGCTEIPANAFFECASVREVVISEGVASIGHRAFYGCKKLSSITLPDSVASVGDDAFHGCIRLKSFEGGEGLTTLGIQVFMDCVSLTTVTLPAGVTHLPNAAFAGCVSLESLSAEGVATQGKQVFRNCHKLKGTEWMPSEAE